MRSIWIFAIFGLVASCGAPNSNQTNDDVFFSDPQALADEAAIKSKLLNAMAIACKASNFDAFLTGFANSPQIRESYAARKIAYQVGNKTTLIPANEYYQFPFTKSNDAWISTNNYSLDVRVQNQQTNLVLVNWAYKPLDPAATHTEAAIKMAQEKGKLEFRLVKGCWRLISDRRS